MPQRSYRLALFVLGLLGFVADQSSKYGVFNWLYKPDQLFGAREIVPGAFRFLVQFEPAENPPVDNILVKWNGPIPPRVNHGALFSLGGEYKASANFFFACVSVLAAIGIIGWGLRKTSGHDKLLCFALGLILGGTTGNMYDRFVFGGVRDFLHFYWIEWPVFNVADCFLVCGAGLLLIQAIFGAKHPQETTNPTLVEKLLGATTTEVPPASNR